MSVERQLASRTRGPGSRKLATPAASQQPDNSVSAGAPHPSDRDVRGCRRTAVNPGVRRAACRPDHITQNWTGNRGPDNGRSSSEWRAGLNMTSGKGTSQAGRDRLRQRRSRRNVSAQALRGDDPGRGSRCSAFHPGDPARVTATGASAVTINRTPLSSATHQALPHHRPRQAAEPRTDPRSPTADIPRRRVSTILSAAAPTPRCWPCRQVFCVPRL